MVKTPFLGTAYSSRSKNLACQQLINLYPELVDTKDGKDVAAFFMTPGLDLLSTVGTGPIRGVRSVNGVLIVVSGPGVYAVSQTYSVVFLGSIGTSSGPVSMVDNGNQVGIFDGQAGYAIATTYAASTVSVAPVPIGLTASVGFAPGDIVTLAGGSPVPAWAGQVQQQTATSVTVVNVGSGASNLSAVGSLTVVNVGSGGTAGTATIIGTTGTGSRFTASVVISGGSISLINGVTFAGQYTTNPTNSLLEPVTGGGLTGAVVAIGMVPLPQTFTGTTGTGVKFTFQGYVALGGGGLVGAGNLLSGGLYSTLPPDLSAEPITGKGITGATVSVTMDDAVQSTVLTVETTQVANVTLKSGGTGGANLCQVASLTVVNAGTGGTTGQATVTGTTGVGTYFQMIVSIAGGAITGITQITVPGSYTTNPTTLTAEPITGGGLSGATVSLTMQPIAQVVTGTTGTGTMFTANVFIAIGGGAITSISGIVNAGNYFTNPTTLGGETVTGLGLTGAIVSLVMSPATATITTPGLYSVIPSGTVTQASTSGSGSASYWTLTWTAFLGTMFQLALPFPNPGIATYQDGFVLVNQAGSQRFWQSDQNDLTTFPGLNFASAAGQADNVVSLVSSHREIWVAKAKTVEVWDNVGSAGFAFQTNTGVFTEVGCIAPYSFIKVGETVCWLSQNSDGQGIVVQSSGYAPKRVSTHAIETAIASYHNITDAIAYTYQQEGHSFYVLQFPSANATWVFDTTSMAWHQRAEFVNGQFNRHWSNCHTSFNFLNVVGDYRNGNIYAFNLDTLTDAGAQRKWLRSWRANPQDTPSPVRFGSLTINMETGIQVTPVASTPQVMLRWSDDGGHTWSNYYTAPAGPIGQTSQLVKFNQLGSTSLTRGLDRVFEISSTDQFKVALIGADLVQ